MDGNIRKKKMILLATILLLAMAIVTGLIFGLMTCNKPRTFEEKVEAFEEKFDERFGEDATIPPSNISTQRQITVKTPEVTVKVSAECADMVETRIIDGTKYLLIRADGGVEVNGVEVKI